MKVVLLVVVGALIGLNYVLDINQDLLVLERLNKVEFGSRLDDDFHRNLASMKNKSTLIPSSSKNLRGLNLGEGWVLKGFNELGKEKQALNIKVKLKKISDFIVQVEEDPDLLFYVDNLPRVPLKELTLVNLSTKELIFLNKETKQEIKKVQNVKLSNSSRVKKVKAPIKKGIRLNDAEVYLYQVINSKFSRVPLRGDSVSGKLTVRSGSIDEIDISMVNNLGVERSLSFSYVEIRDGGMFSFDDNGKECHGIITNDGKKGYRIRITTGSFAGSLLSFQTEDLLRRSADGTPILPEESNIDLASKARLNFKKRALETENTLQDDFSVRL